MRPSWRAHPLDTCGDEKRMVQLAEIKGPTGRIESPNQETHQDFPPSLSSARIIAQDRPKTKKSTRPIKALIPSDLEQLFLIQVNLVMRKWKLYSRHFFQGDRRKKCKMRVKNFSKWKDCLKINQKILGNVTWHPYFELFWTKHL